MNQDKIPTFEDGEANFVSEVMRSRLPVLLAFLAPWSRPCQILGPVLDEIALASAGSLRVVKVDADDHPDLSLWLEVQSVPTVLFFVEGTLRGRLVGTASKEAILSKLRSVGRPGQSSASTPDANPESGPRPS